MYNIDTNILVYTNDSDSPYHAAASVLFFDLLNQGKIAINEIVLTEFFSIITDSRKMAIPWSTAQAGRYMEKIVEAAAELHFLNKNIISDACTTLEKYKIKRYNIYDHLIAHTMKFYGVTKLVTFNRKDFEAYDFIEEIITPGN